MNPPVITLLDYTGTYFQTWQGGWEGGRKEEGESFGARKQRFKEWQEGKSKGEAAFSFSFFVKRKTNPLEQILVYSSFCNICPTSWLTVMQKYFQSSVIKICLKQLLDPAVWMSAEEETGFWKIILREYSAPINYKQIREWIDGSMGL